MWIDSRTFSSELPREAGDLVLLIEAAFTHNEEREWRCALWERPTGTSALPASCVLPDEQGT